MVSEVVRITIYAVGEGLIVVAGYASDVGVIPDGPVLFGLLGIIFFVMLELHIRHGTLSSSQKDLLGKLTSGVTELGEKITHVSVVGVIHGEPDLARKYEQIKREAGAVCLMIWCGVYTQTDLKRYFQDEALLLSQRPNLTITRLINPVRAGLTPARFKELTQIMQSTPTGGRSAFETSSVQHFEIVFADHASGGATTYRALLVLLGKNDDHPQIGFFFDTAVQPQLSELAHTIKALFDYVKVNQKATFPGYP